MEPPVRDRWQPLPPEGVHIAEAEYVTPDEDVAALLDLPAPPRPVIHGPSRHVALVHREALVPVERLARPSLGLAGLRIDPANETLVGQSLATRVEVFSMDDPGDRVEVVPPADALLGDVIFSPDGNRLAVTLVRSDRVDLAIVERSDGSLREFPAAGPLNAIWGIACSWVDDRRLLCRRRGRRDDPPHVAVGPNIRELVSGAAPIRTYPNLLQNPRDDALFIHHGAVELVFVTSEGEVSDPVVEAGLIPRHLLSPDGDWLMVERLSPPFPRILPVDRFSRQVDLHRVDTGERVRQFQVGATQTVQTRGVARGPRMFRWDPSQPARLVYVERVGEESDPVDRIQRLEAPFKGAARSIPGAFTEVLSLEYTSLGSALLVDQSRSARRTLYQLGRKPRELAEGAAGNDRVDLSRALRVHGDRGRILEHRGRIFMTSVTRTPGGERPAAHQLSLKTGKEQPIFASSPGTHEEVVAVLDPRRDELLLSHQSPQTPPSLVRVREGTRTPVTQPGPVPAGLRGIEQRLVRYERADGVKLSAMLYLPPGRKPGERLPVVFWVYPREFSDESYASQAVGTPNRYPEVRGPSRFVFLLRGYALLDSPSMPIVGSWQSAQSNYVEQLVASARAAVDHLVAAGIADPRRIAVVGRSYGAFSAANLMAHSDLFRAAIAMSGAYNRTLTPFGFQNEVRSFWQRQEAYVDMSPFFFADRVRRPILLIHGEDDENPGTPAIQSERFFSALMGNAVPSRYVALPFEGHHYRGRESVMHIAAEMLTWFDRHVKQAPDDAAGKAAQGSSGVSARP